MLIKIAEFKGMAPMFDASSLPDNASQIATNIDFSGGTLRPIFKPAIVNNAGMNRVEQISCFYKYYVGDIGYWLSWVNGELVSVCNSPVPNDPYKRLYWTSSTKQPQYSYVDRILGNPHASVMPEHSYNLGIPRPITTTMTAEASGAATSTDITLQRMRSYIITYIESLDVPASSDERGAPSFEGPSSLPQPAGRCTVSAGQHVDLKHIPNGADSSTNLIAWKRIYRSNMGSQGSDYQYVSTISSALDEFHDDLSDSELGEVLPSRTWVAPPTGLQGLINLPSGSMAGFSGDTVSFSEPYIPNAYPAHYDISVDFQIVSIACYGAGILVMTKGNPYVIDGVIPGQMNYEKLEIGTACVSSKGVVDFGDTIVYPSTKGLMAVGVKGVYNITEGLISQQKWEAMSPSTAVATRYDSCYIAWTQTRCIMFDIKKGDYSSHALDFVPSATFVDPVDGSLYMNKYFNFTNTLYKWGTGTVAQAAWKSKKFRLPIHVNFSVARVIAETYSGEITFELYKEGESLPSFTHTVLDDQPFRLPAGFLSSTWEFGILTTCTIIEVCVATSMVELGGQ